MKQIEAYLQTASGDEAQLEVTRCDPDDGTFVVHLTDEAFGLWVLSDDDCWLRIVPAETDLQILNEYKTTAREELKAHDDGIYPLAQEQYDKLKERTND